MRRLLEHQKYKAAAELLHERETLRSAQFMRPDARVADAAGEELRAGARGRSLQPACGLQGVLERASRRPQMVLPPEQIPIETRIAQLLDRLSETEACGFEDLFADGDGSRRLHDRDVPRAARNDPAEADSRLPVGRLRGHPRL